MTIVGGRTLDEFVAFMQDLKLPYPGKMDIAAPAKRMCGDCPSDALAAFHRIGGKAEQGVPRPA